MRFTLTIDARGGVILSTPETLAVEQLEALKASFAAWQAANPPEALIVGECDVVRVAGVELDLEPTVAG